MALLQNIQTICGQLAESEAKVARTILADPYHLEHSTITRLADTAETSTSAVLRFCHTLGFAGFKDFRYQLVSEIHAGPLQTDDNDPLRVAMDNMATAIKQLASLDRAQLRRLARQIVEAPNVFCMGIHRSFLPAEKLRMDLEDQGIVALSCRDNVEAAHMVNIMSKDGCLILFSESGSLVGWHTALDNGLTSTCRSWLVTSTPHPTLATHFDHTIILPRAMRGGAAGIDEHPVAVAFSEMLTLLVQEELEGVSQASDPEAQDAEANEQQA